ncbi:hypothetical protein [Streptomyces sp. NBC_01003]|uniref:hypothetical protein n=1 Tax=Streptomyces sp. NBC_01003 TaxID=2903714 RepID=UPI00386BEF12
MRLLADGLWSQYLDFGIRPDPEVLTKAPVRSVAGTGAWIGILASSCTAAARCGGSAGTSLTWWRSCTMTTTNTRTASSCSRAYGSHRRRTGTPPGEVFTHHEGDVVRISSPRLGPLASTVTTSEAAPA